METRIRYTTAVPGAFKAMLQFSEYAENSGLETSLIRLVEIRASQINGCAYCLDMHTKDARAEGESGQRLNTLAAWRDAPFFDERERAALEWTEAVTLVAESHVPHDVYERVKQRFSEQELIDLTLAVASINSWNRLNIAFGTVAGAYRAGMYKNMIAGAEAH